MQEPILDSAPASAGARTHTSNDAGNDAPLCLRARDAQQLQAAAASAVSLLRGLANPERLILLCALADGERCVFELAQATGIQQPTLSQQLGVLRDDGLVATRREGKFIHYRVASAAALEILAVLHRLFCTPLDSKTEEK